MATHSSTLAWRISWTEETDGLQPWGCKESDITEATNTCTSFFLVQREGIMYTDWKYAFYPGFMYLLSTGQQFALYSFLLHCFCPRRENCFLYCHRFRGPRLSYIARASLTSRSVLRVFVALLFASSLMNQCWPLRYTHMVLHSILGDEMLIQASNAD